MRSRSLRWVVSGLVAWGVVASLSAGTLLAQGPYSAQIEAFWRAVSTGARTFTKLVGGTPNLVTTSTDGLLLTNTTAATAGVPVQISPRLRFHGNVWDTTVSPVSVTDDWWLEAVPQSGTTSSFSEFRINQKITQTGYVSYVPLTITANQPHPMWMGGFSTFGANFNGLWLFSSTDTRTSTNFNFLATSGQLFFNTENTGTADIEYRIANTTRFTVGNAGIGVNLAANTAPTVPLVVANGAKTATLFTVTDRGATEFTAFTFANIATVMTTNGDMAYCSDCTIANPCAGGGSGAIAKRLNSVNVCN